MHHEIELAARSQMLEWRDAPREIKLALLWAELEGCERRLEADERGRRTWGAARA